MIPGPAPAPSAVNNPRLAGPIRTGTELLVIPFTVTRTDTEPSGVFDGMMAFTWPAVTTMGIAFTLVLPWMTLIETPAKVVDSGKLLT